MSLKQNIKPKPCTSPKVAKLKKRIQEIIELEIELVTITESYSEIGELNTIAILQRFIDEQTIFDSEKNGLVAKANKDIAADSLQSAHDPDVTYRKKASKGHVGIVVNLAETCADENPVQLITDYTVEKNRVGDAQMLEKRLPELTEKRCTGMYADRGYFSADLEKKKRKLLE